MRWHRPRKKVPSTQKKGSVYSEKPSMVMAVLPIGRDIQLCKALLEIGEEYNTDVTHHPWAWPGLSFHPRPKQEVNGDWHCRMTEINR
jgi:hypothetical protein